MAQEHDPDPEALGTAGRQPDPEAPGTAGRQPDPEAPGTAGRQPDPEAPGTAGRAPDPEAPGTAGRQPDPEAPGAAGQQPDPEAPGSAARQPDPPPAGAAAMAPPPAPLPAPANTRPYDREMSLVDHLDELRTRILWSLGAWAVGTVLAYYWTPYLLKLVSPLIEGRAELIFIRPTEAFFAYLKIALVAGFFLAFPVIVYHVLGFVLPGLEPHERAWLWRLMPVSLLLFAVGVCFGYYVVLPVTMNFFLSFATQELHATFTIGEFVGFVVAILALCGLMFELPLALLGAALVGLVTSATLARYRKLAIFLAFFLAAVATPTPDALTCSVIALPIWILFELSLLIIRAFGR
jgi:sec-independent protein translocase protein TatC